MRVQSPGSGVQVTLTVLVLWGLAVAQPLFDILGKNAEFLVAHQLGAAELILLAVGLSLLLPIVLLAVITLANGLNRHLGRWVLLALVAILSAAIVLPILNRVLPAGGWSLVLVAAAIGALLAAAFERVAGYRTFLMVLSPAIAIFPLIFLFASQARSLLSRPPAEGPDLERLKSTNPVIVLVFDEFPSPSLLGLDGEIDGDRLPNLATLAESSHWFPSAATAAQDTTYSVPAIVTGLFPRRKSLPIYEDYPESLFSLFGAGGYDVHAIESQTQLCPQSICSESQLEVAFADKARSLSSDVAVLYLHLLLPQKLASRLPPVTGSWKDFGGLKSASAKEAGNGDAHLRAERNDAAWLFEEFIGWLASGSESTLYFAHLNLPHLPWKYLPSGLLYETSGTSLFPHGLTNNRWTGTEWETVQALQRHLLQVQFADLMIGRMVEALEARGLLDSSLIVLVADHGASFRRGDLRREITDTNFAEIIGVPLLIKLPGQVRGVVSDRLVQTVDIVPTIAAALQIELPWEVDGRVVTNSDSPDRDRVVTYLTNKKEFGERLEVPGEQLRAGRDVVVHEWSAHFHDGDLFEVGPHAELIGRGIDSLPFDPDCQFEVRLDQPWLYDDVDPEKGFVPAHVQGQVDGVGKENSLAIAINGTVRASTETYPDADGKERFSAMVPEDALQRGVNRIEVLEVRQEVDDRHLEFCGSVLHSAPTYELDSDRHLVKSTDGRVFKEIDRKKPGRWKIQSHPMSTRISGWVKVSETPEAVVVFVGGNFVGLAELSSPREGHRRTSFSLRVSDSLVKDHTDIEVFALSRGNAIRVTAPP